MFEVPLSESLTGSVKNISDPFFIRQQSGISVDSFSRSFDSFCLVLICYGYNVLHIPSTFGLKFWVIYWEWQHIVAPLLHVCRDYLGDSVL
jgi:hypothetical protein